MFSGNTCHSVDELRKCEPERKRPDAKATYCMIAFIRKVQKRQTYTDKKQMSGCLGLGGRVEKVLICLRNFWGANENVLPLVPSFNKALTDKIFYIVKVYPPMSRHMCIH